MAAQNNTVNNALAIKLPDGFSGMNFATANPLYTLAPEASRMDVADQLQARLKQLSSMLHVLSTGDMKSFDCMNDEIRCNYLWACRSMADECADLAGLI